MNIIWIIFAHFIGDFPMQGDFLANNKGQRWYLMFTHCIIWTACVCVVLQWLGIYAFWKVLFLVVGHWICDKWKTTKPSTPEAWKYLYPDQLWHLIQCIIVYLF